jgi:hypothetical protein
MLLYLCSHFNQQFIRKREVYRIFSQQPGVRKGEFYHQDKKSTKKLYKEESAYLQRIWGIKIDGATPEKQCPLYMQATLRYQ